MCICVSYLTTYCKIWVKRTLAWNCSNGKSSNIRVPIRDWSSCMALGASSNYGLWPWRDLGLFRRTWTCVFSDFPLDHVRATRSFNSYCTVCCSCHHVQLQGSLLMFPRQPLGTRYNTLFILLVPIHDLLCCCCACSRVLADKVGHTCIPFYFSQLLAPMTVLVYRRALISEKWKYSRIEMEKHTYVN